MKIVHLIVAAVIDPAEDAGSVERAEAIKVAAKKPNNEDEVRKLDAQLGEYQREVEARQIAECKGIAEGVVGALREAGVKVQGASVAFIPRGGLHGATETVDLRAAPPAEAPAPVADGAATEAPAPVADGAATEAPAPSI